MSATLSLTACLELLALGFQQGLRSSAELLAVLLAFARLGKQTWELLP